MKGVDGLPGNAGAGPVSVTPPTTAWISDVPAIHRLDVESVARVSDDPRPGIIGLCGYAGKRAAVGSPLARDEDIPSEVTGQARAPGGVLAPTDLVEGSR